MDEKPSAAEQAFERCPIGLDATPTICSAASCTSCRAWREYVIASDAAATERTARRCVEICNNLGTHPYINQGSAVTCAAAIAKEFGLE